MKRPKPHVLQNCPVDAEWHEYDIWGEFDDGSLEGCEAMEDE